MKLSPLFRLYKLKFDKGDFFMKLTPQEKSKATKEHVDGKLTIKEVCEKYKINPARIKYYTKLYRAYGEKPFMDPDHLQYNIVY